MYLNNKGDFFLKLHLKKENIHEHLYVVENSTKLYTVF